MMKKEKAKVKVQEEVQVLTWKNTTLFANLIFIGVFNFREASPISTHTSSHSALPFPYFLVHVIVLCKLV